ncbi:CPBP family intramembrane glutamic endopeptidase [Massilia scottii]|uniref:CPBP family intramembrane glutamic endopeptidase n=1 Tax=Massilia scottii TaxID=3057166 RepID=UPI0027964EB1|nr:CPBP family intramembrane glutamic endopeptidase [Massilia sp. CCM 9029]MDQ1832644.1 CPBP family intramembrane metalloprotease [Massilia sp. CCM 9029]
MDKKNESFPNVLEALMLVVALFMAEYVVGAALYDVRGTLSMEPRDLAGMIIVLGNGVIFTVVMHYKGLTYRELFHSSSASASATTLVLFPAIALTLPLIFMSMSMLNAATVFLFPMTTQEQTLFANMHADSVGMMVVICVLAPVLEEMLFRGIILRSFLGQYPKWAAILASAGLFGFLHMNIYQYVGAVMIGMFLGWLYERTRSLLPCIGLHAAYNTMCVTQEWSDAGNADEHFPTFASSSWLMAMLLGAAGAAMLYRALQVPAGRRGG